MGRGGKRGNNNRRGADGERRVAGFDEVRLRNEALMRREADGEDIYAKKEKNIEADEAPKERKKKEEKTEKAAQSSHQEDAGDEFADLDDNPYLGGSKGGLSRKQKEEMAKEAARKKYEEMHARGETDEAKADLSRLAEVKARREAALKVRKEEEDKIKAAEVLSRSTAKDNALRDCGLGGAKVRGAKTATGAGDKRDGAKQEAGSDSEEEGEKPAPKVEVHEGINDFYHKASTTKAEGDMSSLFTSEQTNEGNIHSCRAIEDDFM